MNIDKIRKIEENPNKGLNAKYYVESNECPKEELFWNRENGLHILVEEYFSERGYFIPDFLKQKNPNGRLNAFSELPIATYRNKDKAFLYLSSVMFGLNPIWLEYHQDKYTQFSKPKTLNLVLNTGGERKLKIACPAENDGKTLSEIQTVFGESLVGFHHRLWDSLPERHLRQKFETSAFLQQFGGAREYYFYVLSLSIAHGVLFKDFHSYSPITSKNSKKFTKEVMEPAFQKVVETFGVRPVIYRFLYKPGYEVYQNLQIPKCLR